MTNLIRYSIVGAGAMGREHIRNIALIDNTEVTALCDPHQESLDQSLSTLGHDVPIFRDLQKLIEANIADAYIVSTPNYTHINILRNIVQTNAHLLIEKPLCTTIKDCREFETLTKDYPGVIWTAMEYRYMPPVARLIHEVHIGTVGKLQMLSIREHRIPFLVKVNNWNRFTSKTGGTLVEKCCHFFDLMRFITKSEPIKVYASGSQDVNHLDETYDGKIPDILDNAYVIVDFKNGVRALLELCMFADNSKQQEEICAVGNKGKVEIGVPSHQSGISSSDIIIGSRDSDKLVRETIEVDKKILEAGHHHGSTYYEHQAFIQAINDKTKPEVSLHDGLVAVAIGQAAEISIQEGRPVLMNEFDL